MYIALKDIAAAIGRSPLVGMLGWQDVRQRYRRSMLGPFWLTISMGVMIATIGIVFGHIFNSPMGDFLPFLSLGMILWAYISSMVTEGCVGFISAEGVIKQLPIPLFVHIMRMVWRNMLILAHNIVIFPLVLLVLGKSLSPTAFLSIPGFLLATLNLTWLALLLGILCARYRDLPQIIGSLLQVVFYLTPIMWMPGLLSHRAAYYVLNWNPVFHIIEIVRAPLLGNYPTSVNWLISILLAMSGWLFTLAIYSRYKTRIAYWI